jgi:hypothetical protein
MRLRRSTKQYRVDSKPISLSRYDVVMGGIVAGAVLLLLIISASYLRAVTTRLLDIKVPVATSKAKYAPGAPISGLFFGEVFYSGQANVTRRVVCDSYSQPLDDFDSDPNNVVENPSKPRKLTGDARQIGYLPDDVPVGENCIIEFNSNYCVPYLFGCANRDVPYFTQSFEIVSQEEAQKDPNVAQPAPVEDRKMRTKQPPTTDSNTRTTTRDDVTGDQVEVQNNNTINNQDQKTYTECVSDKQGLLPTVGGIVSCL